LANRAARGLNSVESAFSVE